MLTSRAATKHQQRAPERLHRHIGEAQTAGPLAVHLARHGQIEFSQEIEIRQGEEINRPSLLYARATGTRDRIDSVEVGGRAQIVAHGHFRVR